MRRIILVLCAFLASCGSAATDRSSNANASAPLICNSSSGIRLAVRTSGGGQIEAGREMLAENGWQFLLVAGNCQTWLLMDEQSPLLFLTLSREQELSLSRALRLSSWSSLTIMHSGCSDASGLSFRFGEQRIGGVACGLPDGDPFGDLVKAFYAELDELASRGAPSSGDVRYLAIANDDSLASDHRTPIVWPLATPIETGSLDRYQGLSSVRGRSQLATGTDAATLRSIRTVRVISNAPSYGSTPVIGSDGTVYALYVRDAVPLEGADGLVPDEIF